MFTIFSRYSGDEPRVERALMIKWIIENRQAFDKVTFIGMISKDIEFDTWLLNMESPRTIGDEFALYALCKLFNRHARVLTQGNTWQTVSVEGTYGEKHMEDVCDFHLLFLAKDIIAELKWRTTGVSVFPDETPTVPLIVKPLGLHNMDLPEIEIPELPDKTGPSTSGVSTNLDSVHNMNLPELEIPELPDETGPTTSGVSTNLEAPKTNTDNYVTSLGRIIPLIEKDLKIALELLECDPDITEIEQPNTNGNIAEINTFPCSINPRRLDQYDISKWQVQKTPVALPEATKNSTVTGNGTTSKYNLHTRDLDPATNRPQSERPHREATKSVTYAEPTDESSQDSQIIGTDQFLM